MKGINISERNVRIVVILTSIVGLGILFSISYATQAQDVELKDLGDHNGEQVMTTGSVVGLRSEGRDSTSLLLHDDGEFVKVFIEDDGIDLDTGDRIKVEGEVFTGKDEVTMTVQNENGLEMKKKSNMTLFTSDLQTGSFAFLNGTITKTRITGWSTMDLTIRCNDDDNIVYIGFSLTEPGYDIRIGDRVIAEGMVSGEGELTGYGDRAIVLLYRPEPRTSQLISLVNEAADSPSNLPSGLLDIEGYVLYEPVSNTIYIGDEPDGSSISVKAVLDEPDEMIHKGDLIRLINSTISWDENDLRFHISGRYARVVEPYGPWYINLDRLPYGISPFENAIVVLTGEVVDEDGRFYLIDGLSRIELRADQAVPMGGERSFLGVVEYDNMISSHYLEISEEL